MNAAEAVSQFRKSAGALRRMRCWAGSPERTKEAARRHEALMAEALKFLRQNELEEAADRLCEERRLLNSACDEWDPEGAARARSRAKQHQYRVKQLIRNR